LAAGVEGDPGGGGLAVPVLVLCQDLRVHGGLAGGAGGSGGLVQGEQRVDCLLRPRTVQARAGLGDRDELAEEMSAFPDDAEWTQASFPAVRNPVSSKCATSALMRCLVMACSAGAISPAVFRAAAASAPADGAHPNISERARQARSRDRNWPCHR
jgi:hypothetical protein